MRKKIHLKLGSWEPPWPRGPLDFVHPRHMVVTPLCLYTWMLANRILLNQSKSEFLLVYSNGFLMSNVSLLVHSNVMITPFDSACNLGVIFDSSLTISDHISPVSKSYFLSDLMRSRRERLLLLELLLHLSFISRKAIATRFFSTFLVLNFIYLFIKIKWSSGSHLCCSYPF